MNPSFKSTVPPAEVLIAEDSLTQAQRLQHILEQEGYLVTVAPNGREALEAAHHRKPTLIISDVVMPEMDGYALCRSVKSDPQLCDLPVILVTTLSDPQDVIRGLECRADNFILKPYDEHFLLSRIQYVLINRQVRQADQGGMGVEIFFNGQKHFITADRLQILNLLLSTYDAAIQRNKELSLAQNSLRRLNTSLEEANNELEAFSYSISHDLQAPLRHINGFSQILLQRFSADLPVEAVPLLNNVNKGVQRMTQLINDLLRLSRLGRQDLVKKSIRTNALVQDVIRELQQDPANRDTEIRVGSLPDCFGDESLLRQVWVNLLSNAFKFTRKQNAPSIMVECQQDGAEKVYTVRDNGAGFEMNYAKKLFGVFQRLHRQDEFEGTGVGLSIVKRIVHRHGGRIWAEGEVNKGATFYFTLGNESQN